MQGPYNRIRHHPCPKFIWGTPDTWHIRLAQDSGSTKLHYNQCTRNVQSRCGQPTGSSCIDGFVKSNLYQYMQRILLKTRYLGRQWDNVSNLVRDNKTENTATIITGTKGLESDERFSVNEINSLAPPGYMWYLFYKYIFKYSQRIDILRSRCEIGLRVKPEKPQPLMIRQHRLR